MGKSNYMCEISEGESSFIITITNRSVIMVRVNPFSPNNREVWHLYRSMLIQPA